MDSLREAAVMSSIVACRVYLLRKICMEDKFSVMCGHPKAMPTSVEAELPPGQGEVDFRLVSEYAPGEAAKVVEVNPRHGRAEVLASVQFLVDRGF